MKGFRLVALTEVGVSVMKMFYNDSKKRKISTSWRVNIMGEKPYTLHLYPSGVLKLAFRVADHGMIMQTLNKLFLEHNAVVKIDYDIEVLEDE